MSELYQQKLHSIIIEGGSMILNDLLTKNLWDEIQVETSPKYLGSGVKAPLFCASMTKEECYDGHILRHYIHA